jgi:hypothetical protein
VPNQEIVEKFLICYQNHDFNGMHDYLDSSVIFSDFAFDKIQDKEVRAMWHWFCIPYSPRKDPVNVPECKVIKAEDGTVKAEYRVSYLYGDEQRPVDYWIKSSFRVKDNKIIEQRDTFRSFLQFVKFTGMAFGFPGLVVAWTPLLRKTVRKKAAEKLNKFMHEHAY